MCLLPPCSSVHAPPHVWDWPKAQPARARKRAAQTGPAPPQGPHPACHEQHPAGSDGDTQLPGEERQVPRSGEGVAAGRLRAGRAALQGVPGCRGDIQHHTGHALVRVAGCLKPRPSQQRRQVVRDLTELLTPDQWVHWGRQRIVPGAERCRQVERTVYSKETRALLSIPDIKGHKPTVFY